MTEAKRIVITGGNAGIGFATARALVQEGHRVILACRSRARAEEAIAQLHASVPTADVSYLALDLADLGSVRRCADTLATRSTPLDALINNAGVYPAEQQFTRDGFEMQIGVNYLGHFLLTHRLLPLLSASGDGRIVHLSSIMHNLGRVDLATFHGRKRYSGTVAYAQSKLANAMFNTALAGRLPPSVTSNAVHPGGVDSDIYRDMPRMVYRALRPFLITPERAGAYVANMVVGEQWQGVTGTFRSAHGPMPVARRSRNPDRCEQLYLRSCDLTGVEPLSMCDYNRIAG